MADNHLSRTIGVLVDANWYVARYPDVAAASIDPLHHYINFGINEERDPNRFFETAWYKKKYPDVAASGMSPLLHYLLFGAREGRNPHPRFDAVFYVNQHPEAANNPLLYHIETGEARGWPTEEPLHIADYLPCAREPSPCPANIAVDVIVPVYRGLAQTRRCMASVLADPRRPPGRLIVIDDRSQEPKLSAWLDGLNDLGRIRLIRNKRNLGFVASVNRGIEAAEDHDVVLLNSDTEVPPGWLGRLAAHAYSAQRIASVSPFSNNATICSWPGMAGGGLPATYTLTALDGACRAANAGRQVSVPTTVGCCMYVRRAALDDIGPLDAKTFGRGYGEEVDFCLRASQRGWQHLLACDVFVYHEGKVSFGAKSVEAGKSQDVLAKRYPHYARTVAQHVTLGPAEPARFALTSALFACSGRPTVLLVSHHLGGGVRRHIDMLIERTGADANFLLLTGAPRGVALSIPALPGHPVLELAEDRIDDLAQLLRAFAVSRVHVHHMMGLEADLRGLIHMLGVPFDVTLHDYFAICPQVNLLPWLDGQYCGEPGPAGCNACIAARPSHGAHDILSWRRGHAWLFLEAERVICPSADARARLDRHGLARRAIVAPHEPVARAPWPQIMPKLGPRDRLRIAVIGVLADQKGAPTVAALAEVADAAGLDIQLIGYPEKPLPEPAAGHIQATGEYAEEELAGLIARVKPHVAWFPAQWPETYSYTLSAAITAGLPVVASHIGAFPERLAGRRVTWLVDPAAPVATWLDTFAAVRAELLKTRPPQRPAVRGPVADFYADSYLPKLPPKTAPSQAAIFLPRTSAAPLDLRREGALSVVVVAERFKNGTPTPWAYIRLLQPLDHPAIGAEIDVVLADATEALCYRPDVIATQRYAVPDIKTADALEQHCRTHGIRLLYDLDDDLLNIPRGHPEAAELRPRARTVARMLHRADVVWVSTAGLRTSLSEVRRDTLLIENGLDERLWSDPPSPSRPRQGPVRILCMGTATHDADFAIVEPALARLHETFGDRIAIDLIGMTGRDDLPPWINRLTPQLNGGASYPGFVNWITQHGWDIGIAPLADSAFNRSKSAIKTMDYAALGLAIVASDVDAYRGSLADGPGGMLVANTTTDWFAALARLVRDPALRRRVSDGVVRAAFAASATLAAQAEPRRAAWMSLRADVGKTTRNTAAAAVQTPASRRKAATRRT